MTDTSVSSLDAVNFQSGNRYAGAAATRAFNRLRDDGRLDVPKVMLIIKMGPSSDRLEPRLKKFQENGVRVVLISAFPESHNSKYSDASVWSHIKIDTIAQLMHYQPILMETIFGAVLEFPQSTIRTTSQPISTVTTRVITTTAKDLHTTQAYTSSAGEETSGSTTIRLTAKVEQNQNSTTDVITETSKTPHKTTTTTPTKTTANNDKPITTTLLTTTEEFVESTVSVKTIRLGTETSGLVSTTSGSTTSSAPSVTTAVTTTTSITITSSSTPSTTTTPEMSTAVLTTTKINFISTTMSTTSTTSGSTTTSVQTTSEVDEAISTTQVPTTFKELNRTENLISSTTASETTSVNLSASKTTTGADVTSTTASTNNGLIVTTSTPISSTSVENTTPSALTSGMDSSSTVGLTLNTTFEDESTLDSSTTTELKSLTTERSTIMPNTGVVGTENLINNTSILSSTTRSTMLDKTDFEAEVTTSSAETSKQMSNTNRSITSGVVLSTPNTNPVTKPTTEIELEVSTKYTSPTTMSLIGRTEESIASSTTSEDIVTSSPSKTKSIGPEISYTVAHNDTNAYIVTTVKDEGSTSVTTASTMLIEDTSTIITTPMVTSTSRLLTSSQHIEGETMSSSRPTQFETQTSNIDTTAAMETSGETPSDDEDLSIMNKDDGESSGFSESIDRTTQETPLANVYTTGLSSSFQSNHHKSTVVADTTKFTTLDVTTSEHSRDTTTTIPSTTTNLTDKGSIVTTNESDALAPSKSNLTEVINTTTTELVTSTSSTLSSMLPTSNTTQMVFEPTSTSAVTSTSTTYSMPTNNSTQSSPTVGVDTTTITSNVTSSALHSISSTDNTIPSSTSRMPLDIVDDDDLVSSGDGGSGDNSTDNCEFGFTGLKCTVYTKCPGSTYDSSCSGHGTCNPPESCHFWSDSNATTNTTSDCQGSCVCEDGYSGEDCSMRFDPLVPDMGPESKCPIDCGEHGSCEMYNETSFKCMCAEGYFGINCEYEDEIEDPFYPTTLPPLHNTSDSQLSLNISTSTDSQVHTTLKSPSIEEVTIDNDRIISNVTVFIKKVYLNPKQEIMNELRSIVNDLYMMDDLLKLYGIRLVDFNAATLKTITISQKLTEAPSLVFEWAPDNNTVIIDESAPRPVPLRVEIPRIWSIEMILSLETPFWANLTAKETSDAYWRFYNMMENFSRSADYRIMFGLPPVVKSETMIPTTEVPTQTSNEQTTIADSTTLGSTFSSESLKTTDNPIVSTEYTQNLTTIQNEQSSLERTSSMQTTERSTLVSRPSEAATTTPTTSQIDQAATTPRVERPVISFEESSAESSSDYETDDDDLINPSTVPLTKKNGTTSSLIDDIVICTKLLLNGTKVTWPTDWRGACNLDDYEIDYDPESSINYDRGDAVGNPIDTNYSISSENSSLPARGDSVSIFTSVSEKSAKPEPGKVMMSSKEMKDMEMKMKMVPREETTNSPETTIEMSFSGNGETECDDDEICAESMKAKPMATMLPPDIRPPDVQFEVNGFKQMKINIAFDIESEM